MPESVAAFRLPLPLDAMQTISECIERVYGTGNTMMRMDGEHIQIGPPRGGWGPRRRGRGALPSASNDALRLRYAELRDGRASITVEDAQYTVLVISQIALQWFEHVGGVNYVETKLTTVGSGEPEFVFTMQRVDGATPADKVAVAEARIAELEGEVERLSSALVQG